MSRIGRIPIQIPAGVKLSRDRSTLHVEGPKGKLSLEVPHGVEVVLGETAVEIKRPSDDRRDRSNHGLVRTLVANMVKGVSVGFDKTLELSGVGYRAELVDKILKLTIGFSAPVQYLIPEGIAVRVDKQVSVTVSGIDKQMVGRVAAEIRGLKPPEPYKGKGIKYAGEHVRRKVGKSVGA
jgi:large subunit ribosomal protein L6